MLEQIHSLPKQSYGCHHTWHMIHTTRDGRHYYGCRECDDCQMLHPWEVPAVTPPTQPKKPAS